RDKGSTVIFSTHRMETVEDLCDHIALIDKSKLILEGSKKEVKARYRSNTCTVEHRGPLQADSGRYKLVDQVHLEDNFFRSTLQMTEDQSPNLLIRDLIEVTEVHSFIEKVPSMADIFITLVKGD